MSDPTFPAPHADATPRLGIPLMHAGQARKHITHNEALLAVERHLHPSVERADLASPPDGAEDGARYVVAASADGAWQGHDGEIAERRGVAWDFSMPEPGWTLWSKADSAHIVFDGTSWAPFAAGEGGGVTDTDTLGIGGAAADATNRLAVRSPATLLTHDDGGSHRLVLNRETDGDTASVVFQTGYTGGAELGLVGTGDFEFKVSADGSHWHSALSVERSTGRVAFPSGGPRVPKSSTTTVHVDPNGDDTADGFAASRAVATLARAVSIVSELDAGGQIVVVQLAAGTHSGSFKLDRLPVGADTVMLRGPGTGSGGFGGAGAAKIVPPGNFPAVEVTVPGASLMVRDLHAEGFVGLRAQYGSVISVRGTVSLGSCRGGVVVADGGKVDVVGTLELAGGSAALKALNGGTVGVTSSTVKLADGAAWTDAFASAERLGQVVVNRMTANGTATGKRYRASSNAIVEVVDGATLPGSAAGVTATGGLFL